MTSKKTREIKELTKSQREKRLDELKLELLKAKANATKGGSSKIKEIKKMIARLYTFNKSHAEELKQK